MCCCASIVILRIAQGLSDMNGGKSSKHQVANFLTELNSTSVACVTG